MGHGEAEPLMRHVIRLAKEIGPRPVGSEGNRAAAEYVAATMRSIGYEVQTQVMPCPDWSASATELRLGGRRLPVVANTFSPPVVVTASAVGAGSLAELRAANLAGQIAVLYGELASETLFPKGFTIYNPPKHQEIVRLLEEKLPAAAVFASTQASAGASGLVHPLTEDWDLDVPAATVPGEVGLELLRSAGQEIALRIESRRRESSTANVVGVRRGSRLERLVFCAHYDTKHGTPGAWDNASGVAVLLEVGARLAAAGLACGVELVAFTSEEYAAPAEAAYLDGRGGSLDDVVLATNFDGVGQRLGSNSIALSLGEGDAEVVERVRGRYSGVVGVDFWPQSNHYTYASRGVPTIAVSTLGGAAVSHTPADDPRWLDEGKLSEAANLALDLARAFEYRPPAKVGDVG